MIGNGRSTSIPAERSAERSARLAAKHANVTVSADNQAIVEQCDWIVLSVLPPQALEVASALAFRAEHNIVSLIAGITLETWRPVIAPATRIWRAVPIPPIEHGLGPTPICPRGREVEALFDRAGTAVAVDDERQFQALAVTSSLMATFFQQVAVAAQWLEDEGVPADQAATFSTATFEALATMARRESAEGLKRLPEDCLTAGGVNEQVLNELREVEWFATYRERLDRIMTRFDNARAGP